MNRMITSTSPKKFELNPILSEIQRPHKKRLSRYKLRKQAGLIEQILEDPQIIGV